MYIVAISYSFFVIEWMKSMAQLKLYLTDFLYNITGLYNTLDFSRES